MRWRVDGRNPQNLQIREVSGFLWFPTSLGGEVRWLEYATWREAYNDLGASPYWIPFQWSE